MVQESTITTFFMQGQIRGPRYVQFEIGTLRLFVLPRINNVMADYPELDTPCLYLLTGEDNGEAMVYIGQAASFKHRVIDHLRNKNFWDTAYVFVAKAKDSLTTADVEYLEHKAVQDALSIYNRARVLQNKNAPKMHSISKHREADLKRIYEEVKLLSEFVGWDVFSQNENTTKQIYFIHAKTKGIKAYGFYDMRSHEFVVQAGSEVVPEAVESYKNKQRRVQLFTMRRNERW